MPTVPVQRQVDVGGLPSTRVSMDAPIEAFGGGQAAANVTRAGNALIDIVSQEKEKADTAWSTEYYAKLAQKKQELFWDTTNGVITKRGKDSFSAPDTYGKQFDDYADSLETDISASQKAMARKIREKEKTEFNGQILRHVSGESLKYQDESSKAAMMVARNDAVLGYGDDAITQDKIKLQEAAYLQTASGKPPALVELEMRDIKSKTHRAIIERMLDNNDDINAQKHFEKYKADFTGSDIDDVEKSLKDGVLLGSSQRKSDEIFSSTNNLGAALDEARKIEDPKLREETTRRVKDRYAMKKLAQDQENESNHQLAGNILDKTGDTDKIPRNIWNKFTVAEKSSLASYAKNKREGKDVVTDWESYYDLKTMASTPETKNKFLQTNIMTMRDKLGNTEFKELINLQASLRKGDPKAEKLLDGYRTDSDIIHTSLKEAGINPSAKPGSAQAVQVSQFKRSLDQKVISFQEATGKKPNSKDLQGMVDELMVKSISSKGIFFDSKKRLFELEPGQKPSVEFSDIPSSERNKIESVLRARKIPVTEDRIVSLYNRKLSGGK